MNMQIALRNFVFAVLGLFLFKITIADHLIHRGPASKRPAPVHMEIEVSHYFPKENPSPMP